MRTTSNPTPVLAAAAIIAATGCDWHYEECLDDPCPWECGDAWTWDDVWEPDTGGVIADADTDAGEDAAEDAAAEPAADAPDDATTDAAPDAGEDATGPDPDTLPCEPRCAYDALEMTSACVDAFAECKLACEGPWAYECLWVCAASFEECTAALEDEAGSCSASCPCTADLVDCMDPCAGDAGCMSACIEAFDDCQGHDSWLLGECRALCDVGEVECTDLCHAEHGYCDWEILIECERSCQVTGIECSAECFFLALP